jgi:(4S)-4-hydroxy-5-phosphonooxypentane-2,3-dione isomerase
MTQLQVIARYTVTFGNELEVESLLTQLADATRAEPGNLSFATYRQLDDERELVLLERYASLDAFTVHRATSCSVRSCRASTAGWSRPSWWMRHRS